MNDNHHRHMNIGDDAKPSSILLPSDQQSDLYDLSIWTDSTTSMNNNNDNMNYVNGIKNNKSLDSIHIKYSKNGSGILSSESLKNSGKLSIKSLPSTFQPTYTRHINEETKKENKKPFIYRLLNQQQQHQQQCNTDSSMSIVSIASSPPIPYYKYQQQSLLYQPYSSSTSTSQQSQIYPSYPSSTSTSQQRLSFLQSPPLRRMNSPSILGSKRSSSSTSSLQSQDQQDTNDRIISLLSNRPSSILTGNTEDYYQGLNVPTFQYHQHNENQNSNQNNNEENEDDDYHFHPFKKMMKKKKRKNDDKINNKLLKITHQPFYHFTTVNQHHSRYSISLSPTILKTLMRDDNNMDQDQCMVENDGLIYGYTIITHIKNEQWMDNEEDNRNVTLLEYWDRNYAGSRWFIVE